MPTSARIVAVLLGALVGVEEPTPESLDAGLDAAEVLLDAGDYAGAEASLRALAEEHGSTDHVLMEAHRLVDGLRRCAFWSTHEVPPVEELMSGDILSYDARTGKIKVRYRRDEEAYARWKAEQDDDEDEWSRLLREMLGVMGFAGGSVSAGDFSWWNGVPMHPIHFAGPYTVEIKGTMPPEEDKTAALYATPEVVIACGDEGYYRIRFGYPLHGGVGWYSTPALHHIRGAKAELMDSDDDTPLKHGRGYSVKVNVSSKSITASANGKSVVKCKKQGDTFGQFGFRGCPDVHELVLSGDANTAWLEGLRDEWVQEAQDAFAEEFDVHAALPEALASRIGARSEERELFEEFPDGEHPKHEEHVEALKQLLRKGGFKGVLGYLDALGEGSSTPGFRDHLSVQCLWRLGRLEDALERCEKVCAAYPDYEPAFTDRALLLDNLERSEESGQVLRAFLDGHPTAARSWALTASLAVTEGRFDDARRVMREAFAVGVPAAELGHVAFMMTRAEDGPAWAEYHEYATRNYVVRSDLDERTCIETAKTLESVLAMYKRLFGQPESSGEEHGRYEVYLFSGSAGYHAYTRDLLGSAATGSAGLYSPVLKQLVIWNLPDRDMMLRTIRHEGFHQYLDRLLDVAPPTWFNEGTAEYMETARLERGRMTPGEPLMGHVIALNGGADWMPLDELLGALPSGFYGDAGDHYSQSWALVHYLLEGGGRDERGMYQAYLDALLAGRSRDAAAEEAFAGTDLRSLARAVKAHVRELGEDL